MEENNRDAAVLSERLIRPQTKTLDRPTHDFDLPVVDSDGETCRSKGAHRTVAVQRFSRYSIPPQNDFTRTMNKVPKQAHTTMNNHNLALGKHKSYDPLKASQDGSRIPLSQNVRNSKNHPHNRRSQPCKACTRRVAPERLHNHSCNNWHNHKSKISKAPVSDELKIQLKSETESDSKDIQSMEGNNHTEEKDETSRNIFTKKINEPKNVSKAPKIQQFHKMDVEADMNELSPYAGASNPTGPPTVNCYICGQETDRQSISDHESQCLQKWRTANEDLPPEQRQPEPEKPDCDSTVSCDQNNDASWQAFQAQLVRCSNCGRTFFPERLPVHQRACKSKSDGVDRKAKEIEERIFVHQQQRLKETVLKRIPLITCYICGREFDNTSISLHEPQCLQKWKIENRKLPKEIQRPEPQKPEPVFKEDGTIDFAAMAQAAWQSHLEQLAPCSRCGRTFFPNRLVVHSRSCKGQGHVAEHSPNLPTKGTPQLSKT
ncbi:zinc finger protein 474-like [Limulus polyphemus]|uniref:Zinc finger protein 474-like n=1 Tax=Limulus polyphemus TaxID=6850 RepID=A0ABM1B8R5_LIMPO|nr:zinc finger protein 474-like [Limulus polyphemus]